MNDIRDLLPNPMRERTFQLKAKRDAGAVWHEPQFVECKQCGRRAARTLWGKSLYVCPNCGYHMPIGGYTGSVWCWITAASGNWTLTLIRRMC